MITLDGSHGEGGGQILRTALALSMITGTPFRIENIRKNRPTPGLKAQHLAGIRALQLFSDSMVDGATIGSETILFVPKPITHFKAELDIGTAGPITLVTQTILAPLLFAKKNSKIHITGGTDVLGGPQIDYFTNVVVPQLTRFADIKVKLEKRGYYPKGDGKVEIIIKPKFEFEKLIEQNIEYDLTEQQTLLHIKGTSHASKDLIKGEVAERQARAATMALSHLKVPVIIRTDYVDAESTGSGVTLFASFSKTDEILLKNPVILGVDSLGEKNKRSEDVGQEAANKLVDELNSNAAIDHHNADNIIPFLGLVCGKIKTSKITDHILSNIYVTEQFLDVKFEVDEATKIISCSKKI